MNNKEHKQLDMPLQLLGSVNVNNDVNIPLDDGRYSVEYYIISFLENLRDSSHNDTDIINCIKILLRDIVSKMSYKEDYQYLRNFSKQLLSDFSPLKFKELADIEALMITEGKVLPNNVLISQLYTLLLATDKLTVLYMIADAWVLDINSGLGSFFGNLWHGASGSGGIKGIATSLFKGAGDVNNDGIKNFSERSILGKGIATVFGGKGDLNSDGIKNYNEKSLIGKGLSSLVGNGKYAEEHGGTSRIGSLFQRKKQDPVNANTPNGNNSNGVDWGGLISTAANIGADVYANNQQGKSPIDIISDVYENNKDKSLEDFGVPDINIKLPNGIQLPTADKVIDIAKKTQQNQQTPQNQQHPNQQTSQPQPQQSQGNNSKAESIKKLGIMGGIAVAAIFLLRPKKQVKDKEGLAGIRQNKRNRKLSEDVKARIQNYQNTKSKNKPKVKALNFIK